MSDFNEFVSAARRRKELAEKLTALHEPRWSDGVWVDVPGGWADKKTNGTLSFRVAENWLFEHVQKLEGELR